MVTLTIDNSVCKISGVTGPQRSDLRRALLYRHKTGRWVKEPLKDARGVIKRHPRTREIETRSVPEIKKQFLMDRTGVFPTGLLYIVKGYLQKKQLEYREDDRRICPQTRPEGAPTMFKPGSCPTPYPEQVDAAVAAVVESRGILVAPTGLGKSLIAALICDALQVRTLIVVPKLGLKKQLTESLRGYFGERAVGPLVKGEAKHWITVENIDALKRSRPTGIDLVLIDEFHHSAAKTYRKINLLNWDKTYFKIGLTATPFRAQQAERILLESVLSKVIHRIDYRQAVADKRIVPVEAYYYTLPKRRVKAESFAGVYSELVVENDYRNRLIAHLAGNLISNNVSTLILTKIVNHGEQLEAMLRDAGHRVPFAEGKKGMANQEILASFNARETLGILGTTGVMGEGVDTKSCEFLILASLGKSKPQFMQQVGRTVRVFPSKESGKIILFRDPSHEWTLSHFDTQCSYLRQEYGIEPIELELPEI